MSTSCIFGYFAFIRSFMVVIQEFWLNAPGSVLTTAKRARPGLFGYHVDKRCPCLRERRLVHEPLTRGGIGHVGVISDDLDPGGLRLAGPIAVRRLLPRRLDASEGRGQERTTGNDANRLDKITPGAGELDAPPGNTCDFVV